MDPTIQAFQLMTRLIDWMKATTILNVGGVDVTFWGLLLTCVVFKLIMSLVWALLPGFFDGDDAEIEENYYRGITSYNYHNIRGE